MCIIGLCTHSSCPVCTAHGGQRGTEYSITRDRDDVCPDDAQCAGKLHSVVSTQAVMTCRLGRVAHQRAINFNVGMRAEESK